MPGKNMIEYFKPSFGKNRLVTASAEEALQEIIRRQKKGEGVLVVVCIENYRSIMPILKEWKEKLGEEETLHSPKIHAFEFLPVLSSNYKVEREVRRFNEQLEEDSLVVLNSIHQANYDGNKAKRFLTELHQTVVEHALSSPMILNATANGLVRLMACDKNINDNAIWLILDKKLAPFVDEAKKADELAAQQANQADEYTEQQTTEEVANQERADDRETVDTKSADVLHEKLPDYPEPEFTPTEGGEDDSRTEKAGSEDEKSFNRASVQEIMSAADEPPEANNPFIEPEGRRKHEDISARSSGTAYYPHTERFTNESIPWYKRDEKLITEELRGVVKIREDYGYNYTQMTDDELHQLYFYWDFLLDRIVFGRDIRLTIVFDREFSRKTPWIYFNVQDMSKRKPKELSRMIKIEENLKLRYHWDKKLGKLYAFNGKAYRELFPPSSESQMAWMTFKLFFEYIYPRL